MLKLSSRFLIASILFVSIACNAEVPEGCIEGDGETCTIRSGGYAGLSIGMAASAAFNEACNAMQNGKLRDHPVFYSSGMRKDINLPTGNRGARS